MSDQGRRFDFADELIRARTVRFERAVRVALANGCSRCGIQSDRLLVERWPGLIDGITGDPSRPDSIRIGMSDSFRVVCESCVTGEGE